MPRIYKLGPTGSNGHLLPLHALPPRCFLRGTAESDPWSQENKRLGSVTEVLSTHHSPAVEDTEGPTNWEKKSHHSLLEKAPTTQGCFELGLGIPERAAGPSLGEVGQRLGFSGCG